MSRTAMKRMGMTLAFCLVVISLVWQKVATVKADGGPKAVICHATGSAGNPFVGIVVGIQDDGLLSNNGHLDANGSPLSGHEQDVYLGLSPPNQKSECNKLPPPPKP